MVRLPLAIALYWRAYAPLADHVVARIADVVELVDTQDLKS